MGLGLDCGRARLDVDPDDGGRITSLVAGGYELLRGSGTSPFGLGSFVMAPYAGRIRHGRFAFGSRSVALPLSLPPHGAHGLVADRAWEVASRATDSITLVCPLDERWPFGGRVRHQIDLYEDRVELALAVEATDEAFPASLGWHPWFPRRLSAGGEVSIHLDARAMLARDEEWITTPRQVPIADPPWDDTFLGVRWPVTLRWAGALALEISADTEYVVAFDLDPVAVCVEPQTAPPDAVNTGATTVVEPGLALRARTTWVWRELSGQQG